MDDYAGAWSAERGRCFRLIYGTEDGQPEHCPEPLVMVGAPGWPRLGLSSMPVSARQPSSWTDRGHEPPITEGSTSRREASDVPYEATYVGSFPASDDDDVALAVAVGQRRHGRWAVA